MLPQGPYNSTEEEKNILSEWLNSGSYKPEYNPLTNSLDSIEDVKLKIKNKEVKPWSLICPPPNAYARPHIGNISGYAYQDVMARYNRMKGYKVLVIPGKDHAGLEGEGVFVREVLDKKGVNKFDMDRDDFYKQIYQFNMDNKAKALEDEKSIGLSADFDRDIFTLDPKIVDTVLNTFISMYNEKMIYKGVRIVNYDPKARSAVADNQCIREERDGKLYYINYAIKDADNTNKYVTVATTRPETMFGDSAVAVNPKDVRFKHLIGKKVIIPLTDIEIPVISSYKVLTDFGTGALKITPAHSQDDYQIMMEWNNSNPDNQITYRNIIDQQLKMVGVTPSKYLGMKYKEASVVVIEDLKTLGVLIKVEDIKQNVLISERTKALIEPLMSSQWYLKYDTPNNNIKDEAIKMVKEGRVKIHPKNMEDKFFFWMENLRDWAISRSLWWGYRIPVWYRGEVKEVINENGEVRELININSNWVSLDYNNPEHLRVQKDSPGEEWIQDDNVLDTWFSSGQWVYATLEAWNLKDTFFPTQTLVSASDILENWDSRMMMFTYFHDKDIPFENLFLTGLVLGTDGQKMSKSKGNMIDMDKVKSDYGSDAIRMSYFYQNRAGGSYSITPDKLKNFKQFNNKIWNASKFVLMNFEKFNNNEYTVREFSSSKSEIVKNIFNDVMEVKNRVTKNLDDFEFGHATDTLYDKFWRSFCDVHIEEAKNVLNDETIGNEVKKEICDLLIFTLKEYLKMLHPFIPFITQRVWNEMPHGEGDHKFLMYTPW